MKKKKRRGDLDIKIWVYVWVYDSKVTGFYFRRIGKKYFFEELSCYLCYYYWYCALIYYFLLFFFSLLLTIQLTVSPTRTLSLELSCLATLWSLWSLSISVTKFSVWLCARSVITNSPYFDNFFLLHMTLCKQ